MRTRRLLPVLMFALLGGLAIATTQACSGSIHLEEPAISEPSMGYLAETDVLRSAIWDDGNAEVARYHAERPFYGAMREGEAVLITVKEPFDLDALVKADGDAPHARVAEVMKLNEVVTFQTGVYTYRQMASAFFTRDHMHPLKLVVSSQEWCGITTKILTVRGGDALLRTFSYFGDEGERAETLALDDATVFADALPIFVRTLDFTDERPRRIHLVDAQLSNRTPLPRSVEATVAIGAEQQLLVGAGSYRTRAVTVTHGDAVDVFHLDVEAPHALVRWDRADGGTYALTLLARAPYWSMHDPENIGDLLPGGAAPSAPAVSEDDDAMAVVTLAVGVTASGALEVDGEAVTLEDLRGRLEGLESAGVEVHARFMRDGAPRRAADAVAAELARLNVTLDAD